MVSARGCRINKIFHLRSKISTFVVIRTVAPPKSTHDSPKWFTIAIDKKFVIRVILEKKNKQHFIILK